MPSNVVPYPIHRLSNSALLDQFNRIYDANKPELREWQDFLDREIARRERLGQLTGHDWMNIPTPRVG
jgi:hypothetical protein